MVEVRTYDLKVVSSNPKWARVLCPWARLDLLFLTLVYKWVQAWKVTGLLHRVLATLSQQQYKLSSLAISLVKRRWAPLDPLKSYLYLFFTAISMPVSGCSSSKFGCNLNGLSRGFFLGGLGVPHLGKTLSIPPPDTPFLDQGLSPPSRDSSPKIWKI